MDTVKRLMAVRIQNRGMNRQSTEKFQSSKEKFQSSKGILYDTNMVDSGHYAFVQTHRMYTIQNEP